MGSFCFAVDLKNEKVHWFLNFVNCMVFQTEHVSKTGSVIANLNYWVICQSALSVTVLKNRFFQCKYTSYNRNCADTHVT